VCYIMYYVKIAVLTRMNATIECWQIAVTLRIE